LFETKVLGNHVLEVGEVARKASGCEHGRRVAALHHGSLHLVDNGLAEAEVDHIEAHL
jgi:hypothetical protein